MKTKPSAFIIFIPGFAKDVNDSTCLPAQQAFVRTLQEYHPLTKIIVIAFQYPFVVSTYRLKQVTVVSFGGSNRGGLSRLMLWNRIRRHFKSLHEDYHIKGLLSFWLGECAFVAKSLALKYRLPHYCWLMGQDVKRGNKYVRKCSLAPQEMIAISDFIADELNSNYNLKPKHTIPLGIDTTLIPKGIDSRNIDILGAGSLIPLKRFDIFLKVVAQLRESNPGIKAVICGNGPEKEKLSLMIADMDLLSNLKLIGEKSHAELLSIMKRSRILLHPSSYEGFSGVCLEALASGAHVISFTEPMRNPLPHWHAAANEKEMVSVSRELLKNILDHTPVVPFEVKDSVKKVMELYDRSASWI